MPENKLPKDPYALLREAAKLAEPGYKNSAMMSEDFRAVFFSTPQGKRVFNQIMEWAGPLRTSVVKGDPYATHVREGERNMSARIWAACLGQPTERPTRTQRKEKT